MNKVLVTALVALAFTTGFTCSKNAPEAPKAEVAAPTQEQMAAPAAPAADAAAPAAPAADAAAPAAPAEQK